MTAWGQRLRRKAERVPPNRRDVRQFERHRGTSSDALTRYKHRYPLGAEAVRFTAAARCELSIRSASVKGMISPSALPTGRIPIRTPDSGLMPEAVMPGLDARDARSIGTECRGKLGE